MKTLIYILLLALTSSYAYCQVMKIDMMSQGLLYPVGIHNTGIPNDNRLFILEKRGRIKIVDRITGAVTAKPFLDIYNKVYPISTQGDERGLLGMAFHPDYANNGYFYINYVNPSGKTIIARYQVSTFPDTAMPNSEQIILNIFQPFSNHKGGNLMFGPEDGYLYISTGDGGSGGDPGNRAQNRDSLLGKTLRIDVNNPNPPYYFSAPQNPFFGTTPGRDEIFDWGLRNHWRCSFDRLTHDLWMGDVGQNVYEEINMRRRCDTVGHNYGWRCYEGNTAYNTSGCQAQSTYEPPVFVYSHTLGCSVTGGYVYRGGHEGGLFGKYIFTDYCQGRIWATVPNSSGGWTTSQLVQSTPQVNNNYSSFGEDIDGELYVAGIGNGRIYRVRDTACAPTAYIHKPDTMFVCSTSLSLSAIYGSGLTYTWNISSTGNWSVNSGQGSSNMVATTDLNNQATIFVTVSNGTCSAISNSIVLIPKVSFTGLDTLYCTSSAAVNLTASLAGGFFGGLGMNGNIFNPYVAGAGTHTINYAFIDNVSTCYHEASGCVLNAQKTVTVSNCTGLAEQKNILDFKIYPNPTSSELFIGFNSAGEKELEVVLSDPQGRIIFSDKIKPEAGKQVSLIDIPETADGIYFLVIKSDVGVAAEKIFVQK